MAVSVLETLPLPSSFLATNSSKLHHATAVGLSSKDTHDPDVTAAETQFRMDGAPRTWSCLSHLCDAHILNSLMESRK